MHRDGVYYEIGVVRNDREELVVHAFGAGPARHNCSTKQVGRYDDVALQQQHGGRLEGRTHRFQPLDASPTALTALQQPGQRHRDRAKTQTGDSEPRDQVISVVSATRGWYTPPPLVFCKGVKSQCLVASPFSEHTAFRCPSPWSATWS